MARRLTRAWRISAARCALVLALALVVGVALHAVTVALLVTVLLVLGWGAWRLARLSRLVAARTWPPPARGAGVWDALQNLLRLRQQHTEGRQRRMVHMLRAFRDAAAALPDAIVALDARQRIEWFNGASARLLGLRYPRDVGAALPDLVPSPRLAEWLRGGGEEPLVDLLLFDEQVRLNVRRVPYAAGRAMLVARDVSQLMRLEQVRRDFVANVSHELRTPLTVVHGYLDMIEPEQLPGYESILYELRAQSRRMTRIVEDLLALSNLEARDDLPRERVAMRPLVEALRREGEALSQGQHAIRAEIAAQADLLGSAKELHSAFSNLVSNAVRYTPAGGSITLRWQRDPGGGARLAVTDTGHGIPAQHLPRLTERFYRVSTSRSRETGGTGLGLSIVKHVLQLHQAHLEVESEPGVGSTFSCVFDAARVVDAGSGDLP